MDNIGIIVQARMGSTRLPGKVLKDFCGETLLGRIIRATSMVSDIAGVIIATTDSERDDQIRDFCEENHTKVFRGDEFNVLKRYYDCAKEYKLDQVVRMTADNPFPDMEELRRLISFHIKEGNDYSECHSTLPIGVGMEIFTMDALEKSMNCATLPEDFEHVDEYIIRNRTLFRYGTMSVDPSKNKPDVRLTVDTEADYKKTLYIIQNTRIRPITTQEAIRLSDQYERTDEG